MTPTNFQQVTILSRTPSMFDHGYIRTTKCTFDCGICAFRTSKKHIYAQYGFVSLHETVLRNIRIKDWNNDK